MFAVAERVVLWPLRWAPLGVGNAIWARAAADDLEGPVEAPGAGRPGPGGPEVGTLEATPVATPAPRPEPALYSYWRRPAAGPATALAALVTVYIVVFGTLTWRQQSNYGTFGFDMGVYDQDVWLLSRFKTPFSTIRGLPTFGLHVNFILVLFVPAYWLGAGPHFLFAIETLWLAAGAIPIWLLGRDRFGNGWLPLGLWLPTCCTPRRSGSTSGTSTPTP